MKFLEQKLAQVEKLFEKGKPLERLYPLFEAADTFLFSPAIRTKRAPHVRDAMDLKRLMSTVIIALLPCIFMAMYNTGYQMLSAMGEATDLAACLFHGAKTILPIIFVSYAVGGTCEALFSLVRKHEINEGFLVTGILFPLTLPPTIPLWQVALGIAFGVIIGKEVFGGTGMNVLNPALTARVFLFFSYPGHISGDKPWVAVDGYTQATPLGVLAVADKGSDATAVLANAGFNFSDMFLGFIPGSMGETSALACLIGAAILIITGVGSWRVMLGCVAGAVGTSLLFTLTGATNPLLSIPAHWHLVMGGFAFGAVFMATDPVSAAATNLGRWIYGILIGALVILIRAVNPAYPEGVMLAILFMNVFAPLIDHYVVQMNVRRRLKRAQ